MANVLREKQENVQRLEDALTKAKGRGAVAEIEVATTNLTNARNDLDQYKTRVIEHRDLSDSVSSL